MDFLGPFRSFGYYLGICESPTKEEDEHTRKTREAYEALKKEVHRMEEERRNRAPVKVVEDKTEVDCKAKVGESVLIAATNSEKDPLKEKIITKRKKSPRKAN